MASHASVDDIRSELQGLIDDVVHASKLPARQRGTSIRPTVDTIAGMAYEHGLEPEQLDMLIDVITQKSHLDQASLAALAKNLYPATARLDNHVIVRIVAALGHGELKPSFAIQALLLKWIVMVYHVIRNANILGRAYAVLFNLLDTAAIRPQLCHLLALITRRKHVRPFRIQYIMDLSLRLGGDPSVIGLLRVYKNYYPEIIIGEALKGRASAFKHPDLAWRARLDEIQAEHSRAAQNSHTDQNYGFLSRGAFGGRMQKGVIPDTHTSQATENSVTLKEIDSATSFALNIDRIELPDQLVAVLADPLLQKLLLLKQDDTSFRRVANWINSTWQDVCEDPRNLSLLEDMLQVLGDYIDQTKHVAPAVLEFLGRFLSQQWDGTSGRENILRILSNTRLGNWSNYYRTLFSHIERKAIVENDPMSQIVVLRFYTALVINWSSHFLAETQPSKSTAFDLAKLIAHGNILCASVSQTTPSVISHLNIVDFLQTSASCYSIPGLKEHIRIVLPETALVYTLLFSHSPAVVSRICLVLCTYKKAFDEVVQLPGHTSNLVGSDSYHKSYVDLFNGYLKDLINMVWRLRAFSLTDASSHGCLMPPAIVNRLDSYVRTVDSSLAVAMAFGLSFAPALSGVSIAALRDLEERRIQEDRDAVTRRHAGPITVQSLAKLAAQGGVDLSFQDYRLMVLKYMEANGLPGLPELMRCTLQILMTPCKPQTAL
ncbi:Inner centromere protein mis6 [Ceratocystis platani]|uniref:Inner centromere protein mis6 n=1 Tax=Ceratocystis fimbriata f. sp. platani TaxID=88771 RepID=A0A0F8DD44_CERFI|nr:Inner centromere protein mis6 [Ceratocystis platani]